VNWFRSLLLLTAFCLAAAAQNEPSKRIDEISQFWNKPATPGASVAVVQDGKLVFQKGYGIANLEYDVPVTADTVFHVASVSKQFTAMAIVLLEQDKKLSIDDDVHKYLPELPDYGHRITLRNLLQHTSGVRDQWQTLGIAGWRLDDVITQKQILRMMFRQKELNFEPGTRHLYSNAGFTLLAEIVARVSGKPFPEFCDARIFKPLGMSNTHFHDDLRRIVRNRAYSYDAAPLFRNSPLNYANAGATSLFTTAPDLTKWLDNFREPKVGGRAAIARLEERAVLSDGTKVDYALGLALGTTRGLRTVSHGGADAGYRSFVLWFPDQQLGVAVLSNLASFSPGGIANRVAAVYLEKQMTPEGRQQAAARSYIRLDPAALDRFPGHYQAPDALINIEKKDDNLRVTLLGASAAYELKPLAPERFYAEPMQADIEFIPQPSGGMNLKFKQPGGSVEAKRIPFVAFDSRDLDQYPGAYWSEEVETQYTILIRDGKLVADHAHHGEIPLTPLAKDHFRTSQWFMPQVRFVRDPAGKISGMILGGGRITGIRFVRRQQ
jgi:CubicO group peptidase (beta-lactamase class C family)